MVNWLKIIVLGVWGVLLHAGVFGQPASVDAEARAEADESFFSKLELPQKTYQYLHYLYVHTSCIAAESGSFEYLSKADFQSAVHINYSSSDVVWSKEPFRGFSYWIFHPVDYFVYFLREILI